MVCRGLFEKDKLLYAVMLTLKCQEMEKELKLNEVMALLTGLPGPAKEEKPPDSGVSGPLYIFYEILCIYILY